MKKTLLKMKALECLQDYMSFFQTLKPSRAAISKVSCGILTKFEHIQALIVVLVTCKNEEDPIKNEGARVLTRFSRVRNAHLTPGKPGFTRVVF